MAAGGYCDCLACGEAAMANNRRLLTSETSLNVYKAWRILVDERLKEKRTELDMDLVLQASAPSYICRKCYRSFEVFCDRKSQLLSHPRKIPMHTRTFFISLWMPTFWSLLCNFLEWIA